MAVDGVRRDEKAFGDLPVRQPFGDEAGHGQLRRRQRRPTVRLGLGRDETPPHAELAQTAADTAGVPGRAELRVEGERPAEDLDRLLAVILDQSDAHVFECGGELEWSRRALEEID